MTAAASASRRFLIPEVVQTSAMDCGPAALKALLEGFGIRASYGRLREACQTTVDGTSIDTLEDLAGQLGLAAEQVMLPADHLLLPQSPILPAIVVVRLPNGLTHFVVAWRRHLGPLQIMDPASGRRWPSASAFLDECYLHTHRVSAPAWRQWAGSDEACAGLAQRLAALGVAPARRRQLLAEALADDSWQAIARLDAAVRMIASLVASRALRRVREAPAALEALLERVVQGDGEALPASFWAVRPAVRGAVGEVAELDLRGVVLVRIRGRQEMAASLPAELQAALAEPGARPGRDLWRFLRRDGWPAPLSLVGAAFLAATAVVVEALLLRGLLAIGEQLGGAGQRLAAVAALVAFLALVAGLGGAMVALTLRLGRRLEARLRVAFYEKIPRLGDRYFASRLISDMSERCHAVHHLRALPGLGSGFLQTLLQLLLTTAGLVWLDPTGAPLALFAAVAMVTLPLVSQPLLGERDLRVRSHSGALARFYLDGLLGLVPIWTHGAAAAVRREHESLVSEWLRAGLALLGAAVTLQTLQSLIGFAAVAWLIGDHLARLGVTGGMLLYLYWAMQLPALGESLAARAWQFPSARSLTLRLMEPLGAVEDPRATEASPQLPSAGGVELRFAAVGVEASGHEILRDVDLELAAGSHVAIVGPSGAGKSSLVGLLLGWHRPCHGELRVDGRRLDADVLASLRRQTAWIDPAVRLWNRTLLANLRYGARHGQPADLAAALAEAELDDLLERLPSGLETVLGEGGALLSGGEGQRVRLGRALLRQGVRLVILDEAFRGLDRDRRRLLLARARQRWARATLLCVTHDIEQTRDFSRVLVLDHGRIVEDGDPAVLATTAGSRYGALCEAERQARRRVWAAEGWRFLRLERGRLHEHERDE